MTTLWKAVFLCAPAHRLLMSLASTIRAKNLEFWFLPKDAMSKKILSPLVVLALSQACFAQLASSFAQQPPSAGTLL